MQRAGAVTHAGHPRRGDGCPVANVPGIPAGSFCSATAGPDGGTSSVQVTFTGDGGSASVPAGGVGTVDILDTYTSLAGSLMVTKTIAGPAAGQQGRVAVRAVCNGSPLSPELTLPAGAAAGTYSRTYGAIPARTVCTVHEVANGSTATVAVTTIGAGQTVDCAGSPRRRGRHHRYLRSGRGLLEGREDNRWPRRRPPGGGHRPGGLQRVSTLACAQGPGRGSRRHALAYVPPHNRGLGL